MYGKIVALIKHVAFLTDQYFLKIWNTSYLLHKPNKQTNKNSNIENKIRIKLCNEIKYL